MEHERRRLVKEASHSVPARFQWARFDAPELGLRVKDPGAIAKAKALDATKLDRVVLQGRTAGVGKTSLAVCLLRAAVYALGKPGHYVNAFSLAKARAQHRLGSEAPEVEAALAAHVLLIDEIGAEHSTPHSAVVEVVQERHAAQLPTIFSSAFDEAALASKYGDGVARRIFEGAAVIPMRLATPAKLVAA